jgi:hypothetical protein
MRLSVWQNRSLAYKIVYFQKNTPLPAIWKSIFSAFSNLNFFKNAISNDSFLWFDLKSYFLSAKSQMATTYEYYMSFNLLHLN